MRASAGRVVATIGLALTCLNARVGAVSVTVDGSQAYQVIEGFGANINHRSWNGNELQPVLDTLIDEGGMTLFRVIFDNADWETTNDNYDPAVMNWDFYNQVYSAPDFQKMWDLSAYLNHRGITNGLMFNFQGIGPAWLGGNTLIPGGEAEWAEMVASLCIYARNTRHLQFGLVGPNNEQDTIGTQGVGMTLAQYLTALHTLSQVLDTNGLSDLGFVGPDLASTKTEWLSAMMDDPVIMSKLAHFGLHSYSDNAGGSAGVADLLQQSPFPDLTYWMTEFNVWCDTCGGDQGAGDEWDYASGAARYLLYHLAYGASAAFVWEGYDSQYNYYDFPGGWSFWGMFAVDDTDAVPRTYRPRKLFYTLAQISKFIQPGAQQIAADPWATPPHLLAFYHRDSGQVTLTGINTNAGPKSLFVTLTNLPPVASFDLYYTDATTNLCHSASIPVADGVFEATVPADCVFTLVGFDPARIAVSVLITNPPDGAFYSAPATIPIQASAITSTGSISQVEFFCDTTNLGEVQDAPYALTWSNVPPGTYLLTARATNSIGNYGLSPAVHVTVIGPAAQIRITPTNALVVPYGSQQFNATAADALGTALVPQPAFAWSVSGGGTIDARGLFTAGGTVGGPFTITVSANGVSNAANISIATNVNLAPAGLGYTWYSLAESIDNVPREVAPGINDNDLDTDVRLVPGDLAEDTSNAYEAAGVVWSTPQTINRVFFYNGSRDVWNDGVFASDFGLQFSPDGVTWANAGAEWSLAPPYIYDSAASANVSFTFTGGTAVVRGVRCVGRVHTIESSGNSWVDFATEVQAFAAPLPPPPILSTSIVSNNMFLSWPGSLTNYALEAATGLLPPVTWSPVTNTPQPAGDLQVVILPLALDGQFFRLRQH